MRARAQQVALRRIVDAALDQLIDQRRDFRLPAGRRERPQLEPERRGVQSRVALQFAQLAQRVAGLSALQRRFRGQHEARHREAAHARIRSAEVRQRRVEFAAVDRRARADQRRNAGRMGNRERLVRDLARLAVAAFEQRHDRRILLRARALDVAAAPGLLHFARQARDPR